MHCFNCFLIFRSVIRINSRIGGNKRQKFSILFKVFSIFQETTSVDPKSLNKKHLR